MLFEQKEDKLSDTTIPMRSQKQLRQYKQESDELIRLVMRAESASEAIQQEEA